MYPKPPMTQAKKPMTQKTPVKSAGAASKAKKPTMPMMPKAKKPMTQNRMMKKSSSKGSMY